MTDLNTQARYVKWLSADDMHKASQEWLSELRFIKDEHLFFDDLITLYTSNLLDAVAFSYIQELIDVLNRSQKQNNVLIEAILLHEKELQIMVDGKDQLEEEKAYTKEHRDLILAIAEYLKEYKTLKSQLFDLIKKVKKEEKQKHLIDKK